MSGVRHDGTQDYNYGFNSVELAAPAYQLTLPTKGGGYLTDVTGSETSGTSFAAPQVAGTVGLMWAVNPDPGGDGVNNSTYLDVLAIRSFIMDNTTSIARFCP